MNPYWIIVAFTAVAQFAIFVRWVHRRMRDDEMRRAFIRDMAVHHLPHLYHALREIAERLGIDLADPPPVQFIELNAPDRRR